MLLKWTFSCEHSESILIVRNKGKFKHRTFAYVITNKHLFTIVSEVIINWNYCFWQPLSSVTDVTIVPYLSREDIVVRTFCVYFLPQPFSGTSFLVKKKRKKTIATLSKNRNFFIDCNRFAIGPTVFNCEWFKAGSIQPSSSWRHESWFIVDYVRSFAYRE